MLAAGGRLQGLCCAGLVFGGTMFLKFCDMSNLQEIFLFLDFSHHLTPICLYLTVCGS